MSHSEERDATPRKGAYRAPAATAVGRVDELTAGAGPHYTDGTGHYQDKKSRIEAPAEDEE